MDFAVGHGVETVYKTEPLMGGGVDDPIGGWKGRGRLGGLRRRFRLGTSKAGLQ